MRDHVVMEQLEIGSTELRLPPHHTVFSVSASTTTCLSLGLRPVWTPISAHKAPPCTSVPSPFLIACSTRRCRADSNERRRDIEPELIDTERAVPHTRFPQLKPPPSTEPWVTVLGLSRLACGLPERPAHGPYLSISEPQLGRSTHFGRNTLSAR